MDGENGINKELQAWYAQFNLGHGALRAELLEELAGREPMPETPDVCARFPHVGAYYSQFDQDHAKLREGLMVQLAQADLVVTPKSTRREWLTRAVPRIAATLGGAAAGGAFLFSGLARPSYALDDVVSQYRSARRLHLRGVDRYGSPFEIYVERPHTFWVTNKNVRLDEDGNPTITCYGHRATDGYVRYLHADRIEGGTAEDLGSLGESYAEHDLPIWAEIETETLISKVLGVEDLFRDAIGFSFRSKGSFKSRQCDIFERRVAKDVSREVVQRLYVDPKIRLPVAVEGVTKNLQTGKKLVDWKLDEISCNPSKLPDHIRFKKFDPTSVNELRPPVQRFNRGNLGDRPEIYVPFGLQVGRSVLFCWTAVVPERVSKPTLHWVDVDGNVLDLPCQELGKTHDGTSEWNWFLLGMPPEFVSATVSVKYQKTMNDGTLRDTSLARMTPVDVGMSGVQEVLGLMGSANEARQILSQLRSNLPQA